MPNITRKPKSMSSGSDADIKELIEACKGLIEANYTLLTELQSILKRYGFEQDIRYKQKLY